MDNFWVNTFVNWFPMLLLIGVWVYFLRKMRGSGYVSQYQKDLLELMHKQVEVQERTATALERNDHS